MLPSPKITELLQAGKSPHIVARMLVEYMMKVRNQPHLATVPIIQFALDTIGVFYHITEDEISNEKFEEIVEQIVMDYCETDFSSVYYAVAENFVAKLCTITHRKEILIYDSFWLSRVYSFIEKVSEKEVLIPIGSYLSAVFLLGLQEPYKNEKGKLKMLLQTSCGSEQSDDLRNSIDLARETVENLRLFCEHFLEYAENGLKYLNIGNYLADKICTIHETEQDFFAKDPGLLSFFLNCFEIKNYKITRRALTSVETLLLRINDEEGSMSEDSVIILKDFLMSVSIQLYNLAIEKAIAVAKEAFRVLTLMLIKFERIEGWEEHDYDATCMEIFSPNSTISGAAAEFMILRFSKKNNAREVGMFRDLNIFYVRYNETVNNYPKFVSAIWDCFHFIQNIDNLLPMLLNPSGDDWNLYPLVHLVVAIFNHYLKDKGKWQHQILDALRKIPYVFEKLEHIPRLYAILMEIMFQADLELYKTNLIGEDKYVKQLVRSIQRVISAGTDYKILVNVFMILDKLNQLEFKFLQNVIENLIEDIYKSYLEAHFNYVAHQNDDVSCLTTATRKLAVVSSYRRYKSDTEDSVLTKLQIILSDIYKKVSDEILEMIKYSAISIANFFMHKITFQIQQSDESLEIVSVDDLRHNIDTFMNQLEFILTFEDLDTVFVEVIIRCLVHMVLSVQDRMEFHFEPKLQRFVIPLSYNRYSLLLSHVSNLLRNSLTSTSCYKENDNCEEIQEAINFCIESLVKLHKYHIRLPPNTALLWKILKYFELDTPYQKQIELLFDMVLHYKSPYEPRYVRAAESLAPVFYNMACQEDSKMCRSQIAKVKAFISKEDAKEQIFYVIVENIITFLENSLPKIEQTENENRLILLKFIKPFVSSLSINSRHKVLRQSKGLRKGLTLIELRSLLDFWSYCK